MGLVVGRLSWLPVPDVQADPDAFLSEVLTGWKRQQLARFVVGAFARRPRCGLPGRYRRRRMTTNTTTMTTNRVVRTATRAPLLIPIRSSFGIRGPCQWRQFLTQMRVLCSDSYKIEG